MRLVWYTLLPGLRNAQEAAVKNFSSGNGTLNFGLILPMDFC